MFLSYTSVVTHCNPQVKLYPMNGTARNIDRFCAVKVCDPLTAGPVTV